MIDFSYFILKQGLIDLPLECVIDAYEIEDEKFERSEAINASEI